MVYIIKLASVISAIALLRKTVEKGRLYKEKENEFVIFMLRRVNKMQPSQSNWNFPDFPPVPLSKPELLKLTMIMKIEMYYLTATTKMPISTLIETKKKFSHAYRGSIVTFLSFS